MEKYYFYMVNVVFWSQIDRRRFRVTVLQDFAGSLIKTLKVSMLTSKISRISVHFLKNLN